MVFYQAVLLGGYAYAHVTHALARGAPAGGAPPPASSPCPSWSCRSPCPRAGSPPGDTSPIPWLLALLAVAVGLPFFAVSATSPGPAGVVRRDGSPRRARPVFPVRREQPRQHAGPARLPGARRALPPSGHAEPTVGVGLRRAPRAGRRLRPRAAGGPARPAGRRAGGETAAGSGRQSADDRPIAAARRARWVLLAAVPSSLMLSVTTYLSTDIAAIPLLWIVPLALYLLTFIARVRAAADRPAPRLGRDPAGGAPAPGARAGGPRERAARAGHPDPPGDLLRGRDGLPRRAGAGPARAAAPDRVLPLDLRRRGRGRRVHGPRSRRSCSRTCSSIPLVLALLPLLPTRAPAAWQGRVRQVLDVAASDGPRRGDRRR